MGEGSWGKGSMLAVTRNRERLLDLFSRAFLCLYDCVCGIAYLFALWYDGLGVIYGSPLDDK